MARITMISDIQNTLLFESKASEVLTTVDESDLTIDCTLAYIDEAEKKTNEMAWEIARLLVESQCREDLLPVTHGHGFISLGSQVSGCYWKYNKI